jgi:hypothetical protein
MGAEITTYFPKKNPSAQATMGTCVKPWLIWRSLVREFSLVPAASTWILSTASFLSDSVRNLAVPGPGGIVRKAIIAKRTETRPYFGMSDLGSSKGCILLASKKKIFFHELMRPHWGILDRPMASNPPNAPLAEDAEM